MNRLTTYFNKLVSLGTKKSYSTVENGSIRLVNIICLSTISIQTIAAIVEYNISYSNFIFITSCVFMFTIPFYFNYLHKIKTSKLLLVLVTFISIYLGTFSIKFDREFQFTIILPITFYFILFYSTKGWKFYTVIGLTALYLTLILTQYINSKNQISISEIISWIIFILSIAILVYSILFFIKQIKTTEKQLKKKLKFEKVISEFSQLILTKGNKGLNKGLKIILDASKASRIYVFEKNEENDIVKQTHEVCARGVKPEIDNELLLNLDLENDGFKRWIHCFKDKKSIMGIVKNFPDSEREVLEPQGIKSILVIPIFSNKNWNGFIGFDDVDEEREWDIIHRHILSTIANIIGLHFKSNTDQKKILQQNDELKKLNATKDKLFSIVSHDLRSPFNSLLGFSDLLNLELQQHENENIKTYATMINKGLESSLDYLNNLLEWSLLQTKRIQFTPSSFYLNHLVNEIINLLFVQTQSKKVKIIASIPDHMLFIADKNMIRTVFINLLSNAIKYSNKGDSIFISCEDNKSSALISIKDQGIGMSKEHCKKLFDIRSSISTPGTNNETGTGLGLILCKEFINLHNGDIAVESCINQGSLFNIILPYAQN